MARPRVFVSSTYYDLKHIRSSLELFIESLGFDPVLSEKGDIAYTPERALDESCYREAAAADIFVFIVGGRYGSEASGSTRKVTPSFFDRYDSITRKEFDTAYAADIPIYIVMEAGVNSEYQTYLRNKDNDKIRYAHVDSVNVFKLIEDILTKPRNNPVFTFERFSQIEGWLKEQWAGFFRELLKSRSQQKQFLALTGQVGELKAVTETLKTYLEAVMKGIDSTASTRLIESEEKRLEESKKIERLKANRWFQYVSDESKVSAELVVHALEHSSNAIEFSEKIAGSSEEHHLADKIRNILSSTPMARQDYNQARLILGKRPIKDWGISLDNSIFEIFDADNKGLSVSKGRISQGVVSGKKKVSVSKHKSSATVSTSSKESTKPKEK